MHNTLLNNSSAVKNINLVSFFNVHMTFAADAGSLSTNVKHSLPKLTRLGS